MAEMETRLRTAGIWMADGYVLLESLADVDLWGIPGGSLEPGKSLEAGCLREYREELGLEMDASGLALVNEGFWLEGETPVREYGFYFRVQPVSPGPPPLQEIGRAHV